MNKLKIKGEWLLAGLLVGVAGLLVASCSSPGAPAEGAEQPAPLEALVLTDLAAADLNGRPLNVVATTSLIGDVVGQVGSDSIALTTLMSPGQDPHSYTPAARQLTAAADADVVFVNGWDLEEALVTDLEAIAGDVPIVAISAGIAPHTFGEDDHDDSDEDAHGEDAHDHGTADPHVWQDVANVELWARNAAAVLTALDPDNADTYERNAADYLAELAELDTYARTQLATIAPEKRLLVTNHDSLAYFAEAYDFAVVDTLIPAASTLAEPSVSDLTALVETMRANQLCTLFSETVASDAIAQTVSAELDHCDRVSVIPLYTDSFSPAGSDAATYIGMFRANVDAIVGGLSTP